ncbi:MAG: class I SAM-dependent methyltransferase [Chloroflexota bacterium]
MSKRIAASFRDPSGFMFEQKGIIYRQINKSYQADYDTFMKSGLYERLTRAGAMIAHKEVDATLAPVPERAYKIIKPEPVYFISYPYEWCFGQLREAALLTLAIAKRSLEFGMSLKDASAYNIQFHRGRAVLIDTLSFEIYHEGEPWTAYRQFCQHFLAPLALMVYRDVHLSQLMRVYIDGIPLDLASALLPNKTRFRFGLLTHIHMHAKSQKRYSDQMIDKDAVKVKISRMALIGLLESLETTVKSLKVKGINTEWTDYYQDNNYSEDAFQAKKQVISAFLARIKPNSVWDLGANTGEFSRLASDQGIETVAFDIDPGAVTQNYKQVKAKREKNILPLVMDLTNPSPALGWHHQERNSLAARGPVDAILALALIHHLAIANNVPLLDIANFFKDLGRYLIIEFVPKADSQVKRLLATREDIFPDYNQSGFETAFGQVYKILGTQALEGSERMLYLMERGIG